jgi:hypothetical protein
MRLLVCLLFAMIVPCSAYAEEYAVSIAQVKPAGSKIQVSCSSREKCNAVLPIVVDGKKSDLSIDFFLDQGWMNFQFLWGGKYLSVNDGSFLAVELEHSPTDAKEGASLFIPLRSDPYNTAEAVLRAGGKLPIADLEIAVIRISTDSK